MELMSKLYRLVFVAILAVACVAPSKTLTEENVMQPQSARNAMQLPIEGEMPAFEGATGWLNSKPLT
jgi:hypothetical protein